jgi:hypothetical protein
MTGLPSRGMRCEAHHKLNHLESSPQSYNRIQPHIWHEINMKFHFKFIERIKLKTTRGGNKSLSLNQQETKNSNKNGRQISEFYYKTSWLKNILDSIVIAHDYSCISRRCNKFWACTANHDLDIVTTNGNTGRGDLEIYSYGTILVFFW